MTTVTVNIENEKDLSGLTEYLKETGFTYSVDEEERDEELEKSINRGLEDIKVGRVTPHEEVWAEISARYKL